MLILDRCAGESHDHNNISLLRGCGGSMSVSSLEESPKLEDRLD